MNMEASEMRTQKFYLTVVSILFTISIFLLANHQEATAAQVEAQVVEYEADWSIHVDFLGNRVNALLTVEVWDFTDGVQTDYLVTTRNLRCRVPNSVEISDNEAIFNGEGRILCLVPPRQKIVENMTDGAFIPSNHCLCKDGAFAQSEIVLDALDPSDPPRTNPIFSMSDLTLLVDMPPVPQFAAMMRFHVDSQVAISHQFIADQVPNALLADFNQVNDPDGKDLAYQPIFVANGTVYPSNPPNIDEELSLSMKRTRLFIGHWPETGQSLFGRIRSLDLDPGCFGTG
jgi:hypothetical protein